MALVVTLCVTSALQAQTVNLAWNANTEPDLAGYLVLYGTSSGTYTTAVVNVGKVTSTTITNSANTPLAGGVTYYFVVKAYNTAGLVSTASNEVHYTVAAIAPSVTSVSPNTGPTTGSTVIAITGSNFVTGATVRIGGTLATNVVVANANTITALTPAGTAGAQNVTVTNPGGLFAVLNNGFTYTTISGPTPSLSAVSPSSGPFAGGTPITLTGSNFVSGATVRIGGTLAIGTAFVNTTTLTATTPAGTVGSQSVQIVNPGGGSVTLPSAFTYTTATSPAPTLTSVNPHSGPKTGSTFITLVGTGFQPGASVKIGATLATNVSYLGSTTLTAFTPAASQGNQTVTVINPDNKSAQLVNGFSYTNSSMGLTKVKPNSGPLTGGTPITLSGVSFSSSTTVLIAGRTAASVAFVDSSTLTAVAPQGLNPGAANVTLVDPVAGSATMVGAYSYVAQPTTGDSDGDGLPDYWEIQFGLDPN